MSQPAEPPAATIHPPRPIFESADMTTTTLPRARPAQHRFLLGTLVLAGIAWITVLVSQAYVAANITNTEVRILWFGFVVQTMLLTIAIEIFLSDLTIGYGPQITAFAVLSTVFAVIGVDRNIYTDSSARQALGAGWLITSIVNLLWVIYFTSPPESPFLKLTEAIDAPRQGTRESVIPRAFVQKISKSQDAFPMSPPNGGSYGGDPEAQIPAGVQRQSVGKTSARNTVTSAPAPSEKSARQGHSVVISESEQASIRRDSGAAESDVAAAVSAASPSQAIPPVPPLPPLTQTWKAEALFEYNGSPEDLNELSFKKHEILTVTDKSGKWWEAIRSDGKRGIAPSNYLKLIK